MRKPVQPDPPAPTRERILRSASDLFSSQGYTRVSMRAVAEGANITKAGLYYHFRDKDALFAECMVESHDELAAALRRAAGGDGGMAARVRAVAAALLPAAPFHPIRVHGELAEHVSDELRERLRAAVLSVVLAPVVELFDDLRRRGELRQDVSPTAAATVLIAVCVAFLGAGEGRGWAALRVDGVGGLDGLDGDEPGAAAGLVAAVVVQGLTAG